MLLRRMIERVRTQNWTGSPGPYGDGMLTKHWAFPPALN